MEELLKFIAALPWPAAAAFGMTLAIVVFVTQRGIKDGYRASPARDAPAAQVAAMVVDSAALNRATAAIEAHNALQVETNMIMRDVAKIGDELNDQLGRIREEMRLNREIERRRV